MKISSPKDNKQLRIGRKIKMFRELNNYTQEFIAQKLEMSHSGYSRIERDEIKLTVEKLKKISEILKISPLDLISEDNKIIHDFRITNDQNFSSQDQTIKESKAIENLLSTQIIHLQEEVNYLRILVSELTAKIKNS